MTCCHPLVLRWERGDFLAAGLREGNVHATDGALAFVIPAVLWAKRLASGCAWTQASPRPSCSPLARALRPGDAPGRRRA